ncbi:MAG: single-stranded DNA-binding protein [Planctomycetes bacterium]|nr:single-stranded DNA-binding protein [Planctomycetota bacterium]
MANFNKVLLIGNLTRDPQLSYLPSQTAVVEFGLAVNRRWTGKDGSKKEETCFIDCRAFGRPAETINKYLVKGRPVFVEGRLDFDSWTAQDGTKRSKHRVTVENFQFLGAPSGAGAVTNEAASGVEAKGPSAGGESVDDIPF